MTETIRVGQRVRMSGTPWRGLVVRAWADAGDRLMPPLSNETPDFVDVLWDGAEKTENVCVDDLEVEE